jgi:hypothetical protein
MLRQKKSQLITNTHRQQSKRSPLTLVCKDTLLHYVMVTACTERHAELPTSLPFKTPEPNIRDRMEGEEIDHPVAGTIKLQQLYESISGP